MIRLEGVGYSYPDAPSVSVLRNLDLEIADGSFTAILGPNASGKSTLAKLLNALILPTEGSVSIDGITVRPDAETLKKVRCAVGMVFQNPENQMIGDTVESEVAFGPENLGLPTEEIRKRVDEALGLMGLQDCRKRNPSELSGGQLQKLAVAGALALKSRYIVLDESLCMLDRQSKAEVLEALMRLNKEQNLSIILITHDRSDCTGAERIYELEKPC
ncbi:MAG: ATP-binding cassette domain-containing protein [Spirochaetales bacterium]|nr:ATP-binding cassette domain-containing protein [Spirochaetales bacterium]